MEKRLLIDFLCKELKTQISSNWGNPKIIEIPIFRTKEGALIYEEDFFLSSMNNLEERKIWEKIKDFFTEISERITPVPNSGMFIDLGSDYFLSVCLTTYNRGKKEFRVTVYLLHSGDKNI